jgi:hypothetical protein
VALTAAIATVWFVTADPWRTSTTDLSTPNTDLVPDRQALSAANAYLTLKFVKHDCVAAEREFDPIDIGDSRCDGSDWKTFRLVPGSIRLRIPCDSPPGLTGDHLRGCVVFRLIQKTQPGPGHGAYALFTGALQMGRRGDRWYDVSDGWTGNWCFRACVKLWLASEGA